MSAILEDSNVCASRSRESWSFDMELSYLRSANLPLDNIRDINGRE
jgi:hypothetical protein